MFCILFYKIFFDRDHFFLSIYRICYNTASVLCFCFQAAWQVELSSPTREAPISTVLEGEVPTTGPQESFEEATAVRSLCTATHPLTATREKPVQQQRPSTAKNKQINKITLKKREMCSSRHNNSSSTHTHTHTHTSLSFKNSEHSCLYQHDFR